MNPPSGAESTGSPESAGLQAAAGGFGAALVRYVQALTGLFGLELRACGGHALLLGLLGVALVVASVLAYLFLLLGLTILAVSSFGGGWVTALLMLCALHAVMAALLFLALRGRASQPLFPDTREALRREVQKLS
jgi:hypothetical protein